MSGPAYPGINFVVETGAGLTNSNSYVSLATATAYNTQQGNADWNAITDVTIQEVALIKATQSIDILYGQQYYSLPMQQGQGAFAPNTPYLQALLFPRFTMVINQIQIIQSGAIPVQLQNAVCECALIWYRAGGGTTAGDPAIFPQPNQLPYVRNKMVKVGGIQTSSSYGRQVDAERYPGFWKIDKILYPILKKSNNPSYLSL